MSKNKNISQDLGSLVTSSSDAVKRQLLIQTNAGLPIITIHSIKGNGSRPIVPNMTITQGPTDFFTQPINIILSFLTNWLNAFRPFLSSVNQKEKTITQDLPPIIIIPQVTVVFPSVTEAENGIEPQPSDAGESAQDTNMQQSNTNELPDDGPLHAILPILGKGTYSGQENSQEEAIKRRRASEAEKPTIEGQTDNIVRHIQSLVHQSAN